MSLVDKIKANIGKAALVAAIPVIMSGCVVRPHYGVRVRVPPVRFKVHHEKNCHYHKRKDVYHCGHTHKKNKQEYQKPNNGHGHKNRYHHHPHWGPHHHWRK